MIDHIEIHIASHHYPEVTWEQPIPAGSPLTKESQQSFTEQNPGLGIVSGKHIAGFYTNSLGKLSLYAGQQFRMNKIFYADVGIVSGYRPQVLPLVALQARLGYFSVRFMPMVTESTTGLAVGFSYILPAP